MSVPTALARGLRLLEELAVRSNGMSFTEVAELLEISNTSTMRLLQALAEMDYVVKNGDDGRWCAGGALARLSGEEGRADRLRRIATPILHDLVLQTGNTALVLAWSGSHTVCLERVIHNDAVPLQPPGHVSANIRYSPWGWFCVPASQWGEQTGVNKYHRERMPTLEQIHRELRRLRNKGFTYQKRPDRRRMGAPIRDATGAVVGALALGGTRESMPDDRVQQIGRQLAAAADAVSAQLV